MTPINQHSEAVKRALATEAVFLGTVAPEQEIHAAEMLQSPLVQDGTGPAWPRRYTVLIVILAVMVIALCGLLSEWLAAGGRLH